MAADLLPVVTAMEGNTSTALRVRLEPHPFPQARLLRLLDAIPETAEALVIALPQPNPRDPPPDYCGSLRPELRRMIDVCRPIPSVLWRHHLLHVVDRNESTRVYGRVVATESRTARLDIETTSGSCSREGLLGFVDVEFVNESRVMNPYAFAYRTFVDDELYTFSSSLVGNAHPGYQEFGPGRERIAIECDGRPESTLRAGVHEVHIELWDAEGHLAFRSPRTAVELHCGVERHAQPPRTRGVLPRAAALAAVSAFSFAMGVFRARRA